MVVLTVYAAVATVAYAVTVVVATTDVLLLVAVACTAGAVVLAFAEGTGALSGRVYLVRVFAHGFDARTGLVGLGPGALSASFQF